MIPIVTFPYLEMCILVSILLKIVLTLLACFRLRPLFASSVGQQVKLKVGMFWCFRQKVGRYNSHLEYSNCPQLPLRLRPAGNKI